MKTLKTVVLALVGVGISLAANADVLVKYAFTGSSATSTAPANANVTVSDFAMASALGGLGGVSSSGMYYVRSSATTSVIPTALGDAITADEYVTFTVTVADGYQLNLTSLTAQQGYSYNATDTGKFLAADLLTSASGFSDADSVYHNQKDITTGKNGTVMYYDAWDVDLTDAAFQGLTGSTEFRFYLRDNTHNKDIMHRLDDIVLNGEVVSGVNLPPTWETDPIVNSAVTDQSYANSLANYATDPNGDPITYSLDGSSTWLTVATNGDLSGTPLVADMGTNTFSVVASDGISGSTTGTLEIVVVVDTASGGVLLVETESFNNKGGWAVDQQYIEIMGSPYLLAHGLGEPVADAVTTVTFPSPGTYRMWVRTKDWVPGTWDAPGRFEVLLDGTSVGTTFGTIAGWTWQDGGTVNVTDTNVEIRLRDLTGFDGRCDAIYFDSNTSAVPLDFDVNNREANRQWRNGLLGLPAIPPDAGEFDVVVVGGGIAGCAAALAANEEGLSVALIQDRPLLGGNASSEIRVHTLGIHGAGTVILSQIDTDHYPNGSADAIDDQNKREASMAAATHVTLFTSHRAYDVQTNGTKIVSVDACSTITGQALRFRSNIFIDCTGDGWIGYWAGADYRYGRESKNEFGEEWATHGDLWSPTTPDNRVMGTSLLFNSSDTGSPSPFPAVPWAMDVAKTRSSTAGEWYWEYSDNDKHQIDDAEEIRDHMLRAIYGSFSNAKQSGNANRKLAFVGYVNGKRESRRLMGDYIFKQSDAESGTVFDDAVVQEVRSIDVHYQRILNGSSSVDFLSEALFKGVPKYYIPFRCLYSRNIDNLMMAGRDFSCTHIGLGGPRVMNTCGQMGIATGYAASLCRKYGTNPRGVYTSHIQELKNLVNNVNTEPGEGIHEAEDAELSDSTVSTHASNSGWTGSGYVVMTTAGSSYIEWTVDLPAAESADISFRHLCENTGIFTIRVNGLVVDSNYTLDATAEAWRMSSLASASLNAGSNTIRLTRDSGEDNVRVDHLNLLISVDPDTDSDGIPDSWEIAHGLDPDVNDAMEHGDSDGQTNYEEYLTDTDPLDPNSKQTSSVVQGPGANEMTIAFSSSSNRLYAVFYCDDLTTEDNWLTFQEPITGAGSEMNFIDAATEKRFYKLEIYIP